MAQLWNSGHSDLIIYSSRYTEGNLIECPNRLCMYTWIDGADRVSQPTVYVYMDGWT